MTAIDWRAVASVAAEVDFAVRAVTWLVASLARVVAAAVGFVDVS